MLLLVVDPQIKSEVKSHKTTIPELAQSKHKTRIPANLFWRTELYGWIVFIILVKCMTKKHCDFNYV